uniref:Uncharacterized protein n=1 Tax=Lactuca sativa TaxID=4236 RepID=A0A9R1XEG4_LACSA|nr:hypothetical protein LSAT_V11C400169520 [Lactuca sativa]
MKNRCSPDSLLSIIIGLLKMKMTDTLMKLRFYILQKFDSERMVIDVERKELKVTAPYVHDMLEADYNLKMDFLVLFVNTFCESTSMGRCNMFSLSYISRKNIYQQHRLMQLCFGLSQKIRYRETFEQAIGRYGIGEL